MQVSKSLIISELISCFNANKALEGFNLTKFFVYKICFKLISVKKGQF